MTASLEDFRKKLIRTMGVGTLLVWMSFAVLFQSLVVLLAQNQRDLALSRLTSALNSFVASHEGKVAIVAANSELRAFMRSGVEGRSQNLTSVLTLLSSLRDEDVTGVELRDARGDISLAFIGATQEQVLAFDLCYIGDQLNARFGRCAATIHLFLNGESALKKATEGVEQVVSCETCAAPLAGYLSPTRFLKLSERTNLPVRLGPAGPNLRMTQLFFVGISGLVVGLGLLFRSLVGRAIKKDIVDPLNAMLTHMKQGTLVEIAEKTSVSELVALHRHNSAFSAIARTTQMLAHDVRKPFALFRMTLERVKSADSPELMHDALKEALPEVERSLAIVNGLISDVLNVGGEFSLVLRPVRLAQVVDSVLEELKTLYPMRRIDLQVLVPQDLWLAADDTRLPRVFLNLFSNAIEAVVSQEVRLWVSATPDAHSPEQFEIRAGNSGSYIAAEDRARLFDLFYTSGKKGGTGLGLAIVKKILEGHGTAVTCVSEKSTRHPQGKVEFVWTMRSLRPCVGAVDEQRLREHPDTELVAQSAALSLAESQQPSARAAKHKSALAPSQPSATPAAAPLRQVAFIDDSPLVRWAWENKLKSKVQIAVYAGPREFWDAVDGGSLQLQRLHTVITDHYFAPDEEYTGLEFAARLRDRGFSGRILLASNGEFSQDSLRGIVDRIVDKQPAEWDELNA